MKWKIVLAGTYPNGTLQQLERLLPQEQFTLTLADTPALYQAVTDADFIILRIFQARVADLDRNPNLKMILRWGAGYDSVDVEAATQRGILVTNTPGANASAVSELALMLMLAVSRKLLCHTTSLRQGQWSKNTYLNESFSLKGKLVGILGAGNIGRQVAAKLNAFGAICQYYDPFPLSQAQERQYALHYTALDSLLRSSDIVTLHLPLTTENHHLLDAAAFAKMKRGAILINVARGGLVEDAALLAAVQSGQLAGAGLDCVEQEPLAADHPLLANPNIIVTPHIGGGTADVINEIMPMLVASITAFVAKEPVPYLVRTGG